jgi:hypothetical protein
MIAMAIEVCFIVEIFLTISSMPTGKICLTKGIIRSIIPSDEPRINRENEIIPRMRGKRLNMVAWTNAWARSGHRSALNFLYALEKIQRNELINRYSRKPVNH